MPFWDDNRWRDASATQNIVKPFNEKRIEDAKYMLSVGEEIYVSDEGSKKTTQKLKEGDSFFIDPGQFAFLLTEESVCLPFNVLGFISIRATIKFFGLVNISGFHVDPGWEGKLIFSVFNAGPTRINLKRGDQIFSMWLADLHGPIDRTKLIYGHQDIPSKLITPISGKFTTAYELEKQLDALKEDITGLKAFRTHATALLLIAGALLIPVFKDTVVKLFDSPFSLTSSQSKYSPMPQTSPATPPIAQPNAK